MFIKLYVRGNVFKVFRQKDIICLDPIYNRDGIVNSYKLRLRNSRDVTLTFKQAHDLSSNLRNHHENHSNHQSRITHLVR